MEILDVPRNKRPEKEHFLLYEKKKKKKKSDVFYFLSWQPR